MSIVQRLRSLWTTPIRAERMAMFRISIAAIVFLDTAISLVPDALDWFGTEGAFSPFQYEAWLSEWWRWSLLPADASDTMVYTLLGLLLLCAALVALGLFTRAASIGMWALLFSFHTRNPHILNGGDTLLRCATFYIMFMPAGAAWSLDNVIRRRMGVAVDGWVKPWSLRFAQIQLPIVYFATGVEKLRGVNWVGLLTGAPLGDWADGAAVYKAATQAYMSRFGQWISMLPWWVFAPATWATLAFEVLFPALILWKRTRWYALAFGYCLHVGIFLAMEVTHFSWTVLSYYWLLVPAAVLMDMAGKQAGSTERRGYIVYYDSMCPVCNRSRRVLRRLDWLGRLSFADIHDRKRAQADLPGVTYADMLRQMYVKRPDGSYFGGFEAFRVMAPMLPLCWPVVPLLWLPGMRWSGSRVYRFIARNRFRFAKCDNEFCSLHLKLLAGKELTDDVIRQIEELHARFTASPQGETAV